jgi:hypothetical protein
MAIDIRISPTAFNYADAWIKGVTAGQNQSRLDLDWDKWLNTMEQQAKVEEAAAKAAATRDKSNAADASASAAAETAGAANLVGPQKDRANYIMSRLRTEHGMTPQAAAAMTGNWIQESSLNTTARNKGDGKDGSDSIGLAQWNSGRAVQLKAYAARTGKSWTDLNTQVDFAAWELNNTHKSVGAALSNPSLSVTQASDIVHRKYEVAELGSAGKRRSNSAGVLAAYDPAAPSARELQVRMPNGQVTAYTQNYRVGTEPQGPTNPQQAANVRVRSVPQQTQFSAPVPGQVGDAAQPQQFAPVAPLDTRPGANLGLPSIGNPLAPNFSQFDQSNQQLLDQTPFGTYADPATLDAYRNRRSDFAPGFISQQQVADNEQQFDPNMFFPGVA